MQKYCVYFPVPGRVQDSVASLRRRHGGEWLRSPHVTIMSLFSSLDESALASMLSGLVSPRVELVPVGVDPYSRDTTGVTYDRTVGTQGLHYQVVGALEPYVGPPLMRFDPSLDGGYEEQQRFGSQHYGDFYRPHLTLVNGGVQLPDLDAEPFGFVAESFVLSRRDGSLESVVQEFSLPLNAQGR